MAETDTIVSDANAERQHYNWSKITIFELGLLLLLVLLGPFSLVCFLATPVTTSNIVGKLFIMLKSRLLLESESNHIFLNIHSSRMLLIQTYNNLNAPNWLSSIGIHYKDMFTVY